jgi:hypothetical protein
VRASSKVTAVVLTAVLPVLSACGTTVPQTTTRAVGSDGSTALAGPTSTSGGGGAVPLPGPGSVSAGSSTSTTGDASAPASGVGPSAGAPVLAGGANVGPSGSAPGVTATTIKIGVFTAAGFSSFASSIGFNVALGDQAAEARAVISHINAHGGLAGRKIVPVFHDISVAGAATNVDSEYEAACAAWTEDDRVYAVVSPVGTVDNTLYDCLSRKGVPTISAGDSQDASFFEKYGDWYYQPTDMNLRRILSNNVDALYSAGFFGAKPRIGVIRSDTANEDTAVKQGLVPALTRHGLKVSDSYAITTDPSGSSSAYSSAVLRFQAEGITHVLFTFASPLLFMTNAENQQYYPRYGLHSRSSPAALLQGNAPAKQQHGVMGIGWQPMNDVDSAHDPGIISARQKLCLKLLRDAGQDTSSRATALVGLWLCDNFFFLQDALKRAPSFGIPGLRAGAESLSRFEAASTFRSSFAPGRVHDGARSYRLFAYKDDCGCYQYVSPLRSAA